MISSQRTSRESMGGQKSSWRFFVSLCSWRRWTRSTMRIMSSWGWSHCSHRLLRVFERWFCKQKLREKTIARRSESESELCIYKQFENLISKKEKKIMITQHLWILKIGRWRGDMKQLPMTRVSMHPIKAFTPFRILTSVQP